MQESAAFSSIVSMFWNVVLAGLILVLGWLASKFIVSIMKRYLHKANVDALLVNFGTNILYWTLIVVVLIAAMSALGIDTTALIALLGAAGLAVGIALQDSLKNFASGVLLIIFRPFGVGDFVEAGGTNGIVEEITLFTTNMRTGDNRSVIVPNGAIYTDTITNNSARETRRVDMVFGIGYDDDMRQASDIMLNILKTDERVLADPEPTVAVAELADNSVNFNVRPWCANADYWAVKADITEQIKLAFDENNISIPYPQMDVHVNNDAAQ
jgi:small conductance mechanosensitive channel